MARTWSIWDDDVPLGDESGVLFRAERNIVVGEPQFDLVDKRDPYERAPAIPPSWLADPATPAFWALVRIQQDAGDPPSFTARIQTSLTNDDGEDPFGTGAGPELAPAVEAGLRIAVRSGGKAALIDIGGGETTEPYVWTETAPAAVEVLRNWFSTGRGHAAIVWGGAGAAVAVEDGDVVTTLRGAPPDLINPPEQCPFAPRCPKTLARCRAEPAPSLAEMAPGQWAACYNPVVYE